MFRIQSMAASGTPTEGDEVWGKCREGIKEMRLFSRDKGSQLYFTTRARLP